MPSEDRFGEDRFVIEPLLRWFKNHEVDWGLYKPAYRAAARGWDIEAKCKKDYLLIEAKYIVGPAIGYFGGLVTAPMAKRDHHWKIPGLVPSYCWAIGLKADSKRNLYQIFFDYMARNPRFWEHYSEDLRVKHIFFVLDGEVTWIRFVDFVNMTKLYVDRADGSKLKERRRVAEELISAHPKRAVFSN